MRQTRDISGFGYMQQPVEVHLTRHVVDRYWQRVAKIKGEECRTAIYDDIESGHKCGRKRRKRWTEAGVFVYRGQLEILVESDDQRRLYVLRWNGGKLFVCTVFTMDCFAETAHLSLD